VPDGEQEYGTRAVERLTFFSDAVVAIAITLLAIDLPVPSGPTAAAFWSSARHNSGHYAAFLISFLAISAAWSHHHDIFRYATKMDARLRRYDTAWLLMIILTPFATKLLTSASSEDPSVHALRFGFYALLQALESGAMLLMLRHLISHDQAPGVPAKLLGDTSWEAAGLVTGFALSVPVFFATSYAWVLWIAAPITIAQVHRLRNRKRPEPDPDPDPDPETA
jgi:uncharacterized membrane protein